MEKNIYKLITSLKTEKEAKNLLEELLSDNEIKILHKRWRILELLNQGKTQREIAKDLNVSLCKVTRGAKILKKENSIVKKFIDMENKNDK